MKELNIGGIIILDNVSGEEEQIVEPLIVNKVKIGFWVKILLFMFFGFLYDRLSTRVSKHLFFYFYCT